MKRRHLALISLAALCMVLTIGTLAASNLNYSDLFSFSLNWQKDHTGSSDFNNDGVVDALDLPLLTEEWRPPTPTPTPTSTPTPGSGTEEITITLAGLPINATPLMMVKVPSGSFMMGRYPGEVDSFNNEDPQHQVNIGYEFYIGKYEITQAQWLAVMGSWPGTAPSSSSGAGNDYPAYYVSWNDCKNFVTELNKLGQGTFRLSSEAEWEYSCRAGTTRRFYWGDDPGYTLVGDYAWYRINTFDVNEKYAHMVGLKLPNAWGIHDMLGNIWELCEDDWHSSYLSISRPNNGSAWVDSPRASSRAYRGGGWFSYALYCRSAYRIYHEPADRHKLIGFRLVRDAT
jgi:formylglycine-generating enzyme required for sulfatase activity